ncbi:MAG: DUF302 domain-containing protein [Thiotrichales bacterium]
MTRRLRLSLAALVLLTLGLTVCADGQPIKSGQAIVFKTDKSFASAKSDLLLAIEGRGLVVSYTSHAQEMLDRTAAAAGVTQSVYEKAEIVLFCKADLSHQLVAVDPHNIVACPYAIAVYSLRGAAGETFVSYRAPAGSGPAFEAIDALLEEIAREAVDG